GEFRCAGARDKDRIKGIDIKANTSWRVPGYAARLANYGIDSHFLKPFNRKDANPLLQCPAAFVRGIGGISNSNLHDLFWIEQSFLDGSGERSSERTFQTAEVRVNVSECAIKWIFHTGCAARTARKMGRELECSS